MIVDISNEQNDLPISEERVEKIVRQVISFESESCDEVSLLFVDSKRISEIHADYFDDPTPTDCISIPMDESEAAEGGGYRVLGDVVVSPCAAVDYAEKNGVDPYDELMLYIVHGLLHLMGYDDIEEEERAEMRLAEARHMEALKKLDLSPSP